MTKNRPRRKTSDTEAHKFQKQIWKKEHRKFMGIDTRNTFLLVRPLIESVTKTQLTVATFLFAGSLAFLGLDDAINVDSYLKWSWIFLLGSLLCHLLVYTATLDGLLSHARTETENNQAMETKKLSMKVIEVIFRAHYYQDIFFRSANFAMVFLLSQTICLILGAILMGISVWESV